MARFPSNPQSGGRFARRPAKTGERQYNNRWVRFDDNFPGLDLAVEVGTAKEAPDATRGKATLRWWGWKTPKAGLGPKGGQQWSFGQVEPGGTPAALPALRAEWLNWNTRVWVAAP